MSSKTFEQYLASAFTYRKIDHMLRVSVDDAGKVTFYVHPMDADGETLDFVVRGNGLALNLTGDSDVHQGIEGLMETRIPILEQITELCLAIEKCGASPELTDAVTKASALRKPITELVEQAIALGLDTGRVSVTASGIDQSTKQCSDERPCTQCFADHGQCADAPKTACEVGLPVATHNPVHLAVDLSHAIARLAETAPSLRSTEQSLVNSLINSMATKATGLLSA